MSTKQKTSGGFSSLVATIAVALCLVAGIIIYMQVLGNPDNFVGGNVEGEPKEGNFLGIAHKGGIIVPFFDCNELNRYYFFNRAFCDFS